MCGDKKKRSDKVYPNVMDLIIGSRLHHREPDWFIQNYFHDFEFLSHFSNCLGHEIVIRKILLEKK